MESKKLNSKERDIPVRCNSCKKEWYLSPDDIFGAKVINKDKDLEAMYFLCPDCKTVFVVHLTNKKIRDLETKIKDLAQAFESGKVTAKSRRLYVSYLDEIESATTNLNAEYKDGIFKLASSSGKDLIFVPLKIV